MFDAELLELPDGTVTVVVRSPWPAADDVVEVLKRSARRGPRRVREAAQDSSRVHGSR